MEAAARQGRSGDTGDKVTNLNEDLISLITSVLTEAYMSAVNKTINIGPDTGIKVRYRAKPLR